MKKSHLISPRQETPNSWCIGICSHVISSPESWFLKLWWKVGFQLWLAVLVAPREPVSTERVESILILGMVLPFSPPSSSSSWLTLLWPFTGPSGELVFSCVRVRSAVVKQSADELWRNLTVYNWRFSHLPLFFNNVAVIMSWGRRYRHVLDALVVLVVIKVILNKLNLNSRKFTNNFCIKGFNTCLLWSNSLKHRVNSKMSNFLLRVVLECFSSDLENGTHLKLNNHLYQAECQKQNLLHLPMLKLIPVPLGDRLYPPVLPEYQMSTTAPGTGLQRLSSTRPRRITAFSLSTSSVSGASWCLEPT